jgi:uncharacterized repeat protein (TIGR03803 family)
LGEVPQFRGKEKHMQTGRRSAWCIALAALYLLTYSAPGLAQESSSTDTSSAQTLTTIHNFNGTDGHLPYAALAQATDGNLYGTTYYGGAGGSGNVFKVSPTGTLKTVYSFCSYETIFKITLSGALTTLYIFCSQSGCTDGEYPAAGHQREPVRNNG